ncbi:MAG: TIGR04211 family SH3 domain-containing protein [Thermodesulfobacteriota bacterium]
MKKSAILIVFLIGLLATAAFGTTQYVGDLVEITVRSGPALKYRVIATVPSGKAVEVIDTQNGWSKIELGDDKTGWVVNRYLDAEKPDSLMVKEMKGQIGPLQNQVENLKAENDRLIKMNQSLSEKLQQNRTKLEEIRKAHKQLKAESEDYLKLKKQHQSLTDELEKKDKRIASLEKQVSQSYLSSAIKWFLAGAGVLLAGMLIGASSARRKRSSTLR